MPSDLPDYAADEWDIRISIGDAPLDEAFYYTVKDPNWVHRSIREIIDESLDTSRVHELDVADYPELPFLQQELNQYMKSTQQGSMELEYYINNSPDPGPVNVDTPAENSLNVCTYHDNSWDYRVLDIVIVPKIPPIPDTVRLRDQEKFDCLYLLYLTRNRVDSNMTAYESWLKSPPLNALLNKGEAPEFQRFITGMNKLVQAGLIQFGILTGGGTAPEIQLTREGRDELNRMDQEARLLTEEYEKYESVSLFPPALAVPDGFDVRIQMMEYDGKDAELSVVLQILTDEGDALFGSDDWFEVFDNSEYILLLHEALAYKTWFTMEMLESLRQINS